MKALVSNLIMKTWLRGHFFPWPTPHLTVLLITCNFLFMGLWDTGSKREALVSVYIGKLHAEVATKSQVTSSLKKRLWPSRVRG